MTRLPDLVIDLAMILGAAALVTLVFKKLKQPLVLGYIIAGVLVSPNLKLLPSVTDLNGVHVWAEIGVIFLLFSLGLEFSFKKLIKVGGASSVTAIFEVIVMLILGFCTGKLLGWSRIDSIFLGGILSISSTTIIVRALKELGLKGQKFAGLVFGILIIEDLVAVLLLVLLSTLAVSKQFASAELMTSMFKLGFFIVLWFLAGIFLIPTFLKKTKKLMDNETMLIVSLMLCFLMVVLAVKIGFSAALGAFVMGSILAETTSAEKIEHVITPVKELFGAIFFVSVGMLIDPVMLKQYAGPIILITVVTIVGKALSTTTGALIAGQPLNHSIKAGMSVSQIGEFSFIIATLGLTLKVTSEFLYPVAVAVSAITSFTTPYLIKLSEPFCNLIERKFPSKWITNLNSYSSSPQTVKSRNELQFIVRAYLSVISVNSVVVFGISLLATKIFYPFISSKMEDHMMGLLLTSFIAVLLMSPFIWALGLKKVIPISNYSYFHHLKYRVQLITAAEAFRIVLSIFFLYFMLSQLFFTHTPLLIVLAVSIALIFATSKYLKQIHNLIEKRFIYNLHARDLENGRPVNEALPWGAHMEEFAIPPESVFVGKRLGELFLREKFGINIVLIERGKIKINIPEKDEELFPGDNLSVIGTTEELERFRAALGSPIVEQDDLLQNNELILQKFTVNSNSPLIGKTIRDSGIREKTYGLIVGIERNGSRILNPISSALFFKEDIVWIIREEGISKNRRDESVNV
ncbi:MAG: cation:proton antiporter [Bacteroidota bacterium]